MRYLVIAALLALAAGASADVLWDQGPFNVGYAVGDGKGENTAFGMVWLEVAFDFEVPEPGWIVYDGHFEGLCFYGNLRVDSVIVGFYEDGGDTLPVEDPFYYEETKLVKESDYYDPDWGYYHVDIDIEFGPVTLKPGVYWVQMTPYGLAGDWFYKGCTDPYWGNDVAQRDGGEGYAGGYGSEFWIHYGPGYDVNGILTGEIIPEPGVVSLAGLLLGAGALWLRRK